MSEHRYEIVEDGQIEMTDAEMEAVARVPLPPNSISFTNAENE